MERDKFRRGQNRYGDDKRDKSACGDAKRNRAYGARRFGAFFVLRFFVVKRFHSSSLGLNEVCMVV